VHKFGHVPELLVTFGLSYVMLELVQLIWGRIAVEFRPPERCRARFTLCNIRRACGCCGAPRPRRDVQRACGVVCSPFPATRGFMMLVALVMLVSVWLLLTRTRIGLVIQAR
jgi:branched-chain amino acid transport system permease protein